MTEKKQLQFGDIHFKNLELYKTITSLTLPVTYSDNFYHKILQYNEYSFLGLKYVIIGYYNDVAVGAITAREEIVDEKLTVYIMTFGVFEAYRRLGFGEQLLKKLISKVRENTKLRTIYLHMWEANETGYKFYVKQGFEKTMYKTNYYTDIDPPHCYILTLRLYPDEDPPIVYSVQDAGKEQQGNE